MDPAFAPAYAGLADAYQACRGNIRHSRRRRACGGCGPRRSRRSSSILCSPRRTQRWASRYARELDWAKRHGVVRARHRAEPESHADSHELLRRRWCRGTAGTRRCSCSRQALVMDPLSLVVRRELAFALILAGRFDEAIANAAAGHCRRSGLRVRSAAGAGADVCGQARGSGRRLAEPCAKSERGWERWLAHAYMRTGQHEGGGAAGASQPERDIPIARPSSTPHGRHGSDVRRTEQGGDLMPQRTALLLVLPEMALFARRPKAGRAEEELNSVESPVDFSPDPRVPRETMLSGRRKDGPEDQITFCSGFALKPLKMSTKAETRRFPVSGTRFSTRTSTSVMLSIRRVPTGSASTVTVA